MKKINKILLGSMLLLALLLVGVLVYLDTDDKQQQFDQTLKINTTTEQKEGSKNEEVATKEKSPTTTASLLAVGDILIHDTVYKDARTTSSYDFDPMFSKVKQYISQADIAFANQESIVGGPELGYSGYPTFNGPYEIADAVSWSGFDIVNMANNHTLDRGEKGVINSTNYFNGLGLKYIGAATSTEDSKRLRIIEKNNIKFSFLGYTYGTNGIPTPRGKDYLVNRIDEKKIIQDITKAKKQSDFVVISLHFGTQYQKLPNNNQKKLVQKLADNGADIILGHHPHVLQPIEWIEKVGGGRSVAIYSLGNFLSGQIGTERNIGGMMTVEVVKNNKSNNTKLDQVDFIPTWVAKNGRRDFKIVPLKEAGNYGLNQAEQWYQQTIEHVVPKK